MADYLITDTELTSIASAIRTKGGTSASLEFPTGFVNAIGAITTYTAPNLQSKTNINPTTSSQTISADNGYDGLSSVQINAMPSGTAGTPTATKGSVSNHSINITPSVTNTTGYIVGSTINGTAVNVNVSELVSGTKSITANGTGIDVTEYANVDVNVTNELDCPIFTLVLSQDYSTVQSISCNKTFSQCQTYRFNGIYYAIVNMTVGSNEVILSATNNYMNNTLYYYIILGQGITDIQIEYTSSNLTAILNPISYRDSTDLTASGATVTVPAGYYSSQATKSINNGSATGPSSLSGSSATVSTGTNTITLTKTGVATTPTVSAGYVSAATSSTATVALTASITTKGAATITPGTSNQTIASGTYLTGTQTIAGDADLVASNIISTANIFGVQGSVVINKYYTGTSAPSSSLGNNGDIYIQQEEE